MNHRLTAYENNLKKNRLLEKSGLFLEERIWTRVHILSRLLMLHHNQYNLTVYERYDIEIRVPPGFNGFPAACGNVLGRRIPP